MEKFDVQPLEQAIARLGLIENAEAWIHYEARTESSHAYPAQIAQSVFDRAKIFLPDARALLKVPRDAFSGSNIPHKVDILDWTRITPDFRAIIESRHEDL